MVIYKKLPTFLTNFQTLLSSKIFDKAKIFRWAKYIIFANIDNLNNFAHPTNMEKCYNHLLLNYQYYKL